MKFMELILGSAAIFIGPVSSESANLITSTQATITTPSSTTTDINSLVNQLPTCALPCLNSAAEAISCSVSDLTCLCSKSSQLAKHIGPCIMFSSCSPADKSTLLTSAQEICQDVGAAQPSQIAAASSYIAAAVASETASTAHGMLVVWAGGPVAGVGIMVAAAVLALLTL